MSETYWQHYAHPADMGIRGVGPTKDEAFAQAALAMTAVICELNTVSPREQVVVRCEEADDELLLMAWLNALLYEMDSRRMLFSKFDISIEAGRLTATALGEPIDVSRHAPAVEVKAATLADLKVEQDAAGNWVAQCIVDV